MNSVRVACCRAEHHARRAACWPRRRRRSRSSRSLNTALLAPDRFGKGRGWAIGGWPIPQANFWLPYRTPVDLWGAATPLKATASSPYRE
ncbi:DUF4328 domain-containing protein [Streptomyces sp. TG1A-60]|uniref:DUF4328 domain-containing protein n=1 Tax=Streptomyces sp. TG1A-60 TaxID=3129111 RepID=UPI0030D40759